MDSSDSIESSNKKWIATAFFQNASQWRKNSKIPRNSAESSNDRFCYFWIATKILAYFLAMTIPLWPSLRMSEASEAIHLIINILETQNHKNIMILVFHL